jgi:DNA-binding response OmpR family regulator
VNGPSWNTCCCRSPKPANKDKLLLALTGWDKEITPNAVEVYISRLRGKLEPFGLALEIDSRVWLSP